jgi:transposase InsO family protein
MGPLELLRTQGPASGPSRLPARLQRDRELESQIRRVWDENFQVYGVRKTWRQLRREDIAAARCTVTRLMARLGLRGAVRRRAFKTTTVSCAALARPQDRVKRNFVAARPDTLWVSDLTYGATWRGFICVAFVIDAFARRIVGWRVPNTLRTDLALDALQQALYARSQAAQQPLVHQRPGGSQYLSIRYNRAAQGCQTGTLGGQRWRFLGPSAFSKCSRHGAGIGLPSCRSRSAAANTSISARARKSASVSIARLMRSPLRGLHASRVKVSRFSPHWARRGKN